MPLPQATKLSEHIIGFNSIRLKRRLRQKTGGLAAKWWTSPRITISKLSISEELSGWRPTRRCPRKTTPAAAAGAGISSPTSRKTTPAAAGAEISFPTSYPTSSPMPAASSPMPAASSPMPAAETREHWPSRQEQSRAQTSSTTASADIVERSLTLYEAARYALGRVAVSKVAKVHCHSEEFRLRVHACGLRLLDSIAHCASLFPPSTEKPDSYDVKVITLSIYGVAFGFEDDAEVSDREWTRHAVGVKARDVAKMENRVCNLFFEQGKGSLRPRPAML